MSDEKKVVTYVGKKPYELVKIPMGLKETGTNNPIPSVRVRFTIGENGFTYSTSDPEMIKWLDNHEHMKRGFIEHLDTEEAKELIRMAKEHQPRVSHGVITAIPDGAVSRADGRTKLGRQIAGR